jgi:guanylate kinase
VIVNDDFDTALDDLTAIVRAWPLRRIRQERRVAALLDETPAHDTMDD